MSLEEESRKGKEVQSLAENPVFQSAMTAVKAKIYSQWASTSFFQRRKREELWKMMRIAEVFESELVQAVENGKAAEAFLKSKNKK